MVDRRAVSSVIGVVMILGLTLVTITTLLMVGTTVLDDARSDAQAAQMENSMAQVSSKASLVALGESDGQSVDFGGLGDGTLAVRPDAGRITVTYEPEDNQSNVLANRSFGALVYTVGDTEIAMQGGGVWKVSDGTTTMLSPPEYHYQVHTLTFPIIRMVGVAGTADTGDGFISTEGAPEAIYPTDSHPNPLENGTVTVEIQSEYHRGWYHFFEHRTDGAVEHDPANRTVTVDLTVLFESAYDHPVAATQSGGIDVHEPGGVPDSWEDGVSGYPSASSAVESAIDDCADGGCEPFDGSTPLDGNETYVANSSVELEEPLEFNTSEGDITVVIDGQLDVGHEDIEVAGDGNVTIYLAEGFVVNGQSKINDNENTSAGQFQLFVHSDASEGGSHHPIDIGPATINGVIYAPNTDARVHGNVDFTGSMIFETVAIHGASASDIEYDETLEELELGLETEYSEVKYLHVTENRIEVDLEGGPP